MSTSRRGFLKSVIAAVMLSPVVCRLAEGAVQVAPKPVETIVNPAWENADYEVSFFVHPSLAPGWPMRIQENAPRFNWDGKKFIRVT